MDETKVRAYYRAPRFLPNFLFSLIIVVLLMLLLLFWCLLSAERDVPLSSLHALCDEVQPDVQGQPDRTHLRRGGSHRPLRRSGDGE